MHRFYWLLAICLSAFCALLAANLQAATPTDKVRFYFNLFSGGERAVVDIELYGNESPLHVANFLDYLDDGEYDDSVIHRTRALPALFAQGGSYKLTPANQLTTITPRDPIPNEFDLDNELRNDPGTLSAARTSDLDSATSGWFINSTDNGGFDNPISPYTVFGRVTSGMALIDALPNPALNDPTLQGTPLETMPFFGSSSPVPAVIISAIRIGVVEGDYNLDGVVDSADYSVWLASLGTSVAAGVRDLQADGNGDGFIDHLDHDVWKWNLGATAATGSVSSTSGGIPEPASGILLVLAVALLGHRRRR